MLREQSASRPGQNRQAVSAADVVGRAVTRPGLRTLFWLGLALVLVGAWGMYRRRLRMRA